MSEYGSSEPTRAVGVVDGPPEPPGGPPFGPPPGEPDRRWWWLGGLAGLIVILAIVLLLLSGGDDDDSLVADATSSTTSSSTTSSTSSTSSTTSSTTTSTLPPTTPTTAATTSSTVATTSSVPLTILPALCVRSADEDATANLAYQAYAFGDRQCAGEIMTQEAADELFAIPGGGGGWAFQGCTELDEPNGHMDCAYTFEGGATHFLMERDGNNEWVIYDVAQTTD